MSVEPGAPLMVNGIFGCVTHVGDLGVVGVRLVNRRGAPGRLLIAAEVVVEQMSRQFLEEAATAGIEDQVEKYAARTRHVLP